MDVVLVGFVAGLTFGGWRTGFIKRLAGLAFVALSFLLGAYLRGPFGALVHSLFPDVPAEYAELVGYAFAFPIILAVLHLLARPFLKDKHMNGMTHELDQALGAILGFIEAVLILSVIVVIFDTYFATGGQLGGLFGSTAIRGLVTSFNESYTVHLLRSTTVPVVLAVLGPLLPKDISTLLPSGVPGMPGIPSFPGRHIPSPRT